MSDVLPPNPRQSEVAQLMQDSQRAFLMQGGAFANALRKMRADGQIPTSYQYHEYPKEVRISRGTEKVNRSTMTADKEKVEWTEERKIEDVFIVYSEDEEERVLNGGKTAAQVEEDRLELIATAKARGLKFDPTWSAIRLRRELGIPDASANQTAAFDEVDELEKQVAKARRAIALRKELADLNAELADAPAEAPATDDAEGLREQLRALGVKPDGRWSVAKLQQELEAATAPGVAA